MSNPRPDPPRVIGWKFNGEDYAAVKQATWDALLADLRTLEAQYRERAIDEDKRYRRVADDLAALLAKLEA